MTQLCAAVRKHMRKGETMQYIYPLNGVYHTHQHGDFTSWHDAHGWDASCDREHFHAQADMDWVREEASDALYTWILEQDISSFFTCASSARAQVSFELDAWNDDEPVACSRTYKLEAMRHHDVYGHMQEHRDEKRWRGSRVRGTKQYDVAMRGHLFEEWTPLTEAHDSWKNHRAYQEHGREVTPPLPYGAWGQTI